MERGGSTALTQVPEGSMGKETIYMDKQPASDRQPCASNSVLQLLSIADGAPLIPNEN